VIGLLAWVAMAVVIGVWIDSDGVRTETVASYPGQAAHGVPNSARIYVQLKVGWFDPQKNFDIEVTGPSRQTVEGHSTLDSNEILSFTPDGPLDTGVHTVAVHHRESPLSEANVLDSWPITVATAPSLSADLGGSILLVAREGTRDAYLAEILRAEGFTGFDTVTPEQVASDRLANRTVVILGASSATGPHLADVESWVSGGGELITMMPAGRLATLAGLTAIGQKLEDAYIAIDTTQAPGAGLTAERMQVQGDALVYTAATDNRIIASLSSDLEPSGPHPALSLTSVGTSGGHIAAFSFDLATSVLYTRQGHPAAAGVERDGSPPIRPNDLFIAAAGEPGHLDESKLGIPQADEQMRLLSNLLVDLHGETSPLPRFWYLPHGDKAALVMAADDHATDGGTRQSFERMLSLAEPGCDVALWECPRATALMYPSPQFSAEEADYYSDLGFDLGAHVSTDCSDWTEESLDTAFAVTMLEFRSTYPGIPDQATHRLHCVAFSDWLGLPLAEQRWGIRLDMTYYNWPPSWIQGRPGYMTGSALPMRFSDDNGRLLSVFQQESHLVNETWNGSTAAIEELITAAEDERGYFGAIGTHYDFADDFDEQLMDIAIRRDVPMVSARQLLDFTEGRQSSRFTDVKQTDTGGIAFNVDVDARANGMLHAMLPVHSGESVLTSLTADGAAIGYDVERIKGIIYAVFEADDSRYEGVYQPISPG
jgi:hypothetical protein